MRLIFVLFILSLLPSSVYGQKIISLTSLDESLKETSGLIYLNQKLITHNDSDGEPALYEVDSINGMVTRKVIVSNATNTDWEDISRDSAFIYIGDFGNDGSRTDLKIYRISISSYLNTTNDSVTADTIHFSYADQSDFTPDQFSTNFDAEALIAYNDSLYIFTKNWGDNLTNVYSCPKTPGTYIISKVDVINAQCLVTGATYNPLSNAVILLGYTLVTPYIIEISNFTLNSFSNGTVNKYALARQPDYSYQMEGISYFGENQYYITAEEFGTLKSALYRLDTDEVSGFESLAEFSTLIYPNPTSDVVYIDNIHDLSTVEIYDLHGVLQKISSGEEIYISDLRRGVYIISIEDPGKDKSVFGKLVIE
jgi:hypothetical protein